MSDACDQERVLFIDVSSWLFVSGCLSRSSCALSVALLLQKQRCPTTTTDLAYSPRRRSRRAKASSQPNPSARSLTRRHRLRRSTPATSRVDSTCTTRTLVSFAPCLILAFVNRRACLLHSPRHSVPHPFATVPRYVPHAAEGRGEEACARAAARERPVAATIRAKGVRRGECGSWRDAYALQRRRHGNLRMEKRLSGSAVLTKLRAELDRRALHVPSSCALCITDRALLCGVETRESTHTAFGLWCPCVLHGEWCAVVLAARC